jgi:hypothetical protein
MTNMKFGRLLPLAMVLMMILFAAPPVAAATIQIGTFDWDAIAEDEDEFLFFCDPASPCSRFTVTNDLDDLTSSELLQLGLPSSDIPFDDVELPGVVPGSLGSLTAAIGSFTWIASGEFSLVSVAFQLPGSLLGTLMLPNLTGPAGDPAPIYIVTNDVPAVPEPATLTLVAAGLAAACVRRRRSRLVD